MSEFLNNHELNELSFLISQSMDGSIAREDIQRLENMLESSSQMRAYYREYLSIYCDLTSLLGGEQLNTSEANSLEDDEFWKAMAEYEKKAPMIEISQEKPKNELIQKVVYPRPGHNKKLSKWQLGTVITAVAAMLLVGLFIRFAPQKSGYEVATLADSINTRWADTTRPMQKGTRLVTGNTNLLLREGFVELLFDNDTKVTLEAPAEFQILMEDQIKLHYGRLYAIVPRQAIGFTVNTPSARVIDLGTEFGVEADPYGDIYLHVVKGKTTLIAGGKFSKSSIEVDEGIAKKVAGATQEVSDTAFEANRFVRAIDSAEKLLWRGQKELNLADMVGGGNGFGTGKLDWAIDPLTGKQTSICKALPFLGQNKYITVPWSDFIDGVFTISADSNAVLVSSRGHQFEECPATSGRFWGDIVNGAKIVQHGQNVSYSEFQYEGTLQGQKYGTPVDPAIFMEPNMGITFNLDEIRRSLPVGLKIHSFGSLCGLCDSDQDISKSDFWVLVDGKVQDHKIGLQSNGKPVPSNVLLNETDHFLTLITTDNDGNLTRDWCLFARPTLYLEITQE